MTKLTVIQDPLPSDNFQFGGQPLNQIILYLTGTNLDAEEDIRINTMTKYYSGKLAVYSDDPLLSHKIIIKSENIDTGVDKTVTFRNPTIADDFFVTEQQNQILYNKVLSTNTQVTANLTFTSPAAILGATLSGASNTLSNIPNSALLQITDKTKLNSNIVYTDALATYGDFNQTFRSGRLIIRNPANTFGYIITGGSITTADKVLTLPAVTGPDTFTTNDASQTLKNKIENIDENTFKHSTTNAAGDILYYDSTATKYTRKPQGGNGTFLGVSGGVLGYYTPPDTGEVNTIANIGTGGVSIVPDNPKTGVVLNFKSMFPASTKLSIVDGTTANDRVEFDVVEANLNIANMTGSIGNARLVDLAYTKLTGVPTTFAPTAHGSSHASNGTDAIPIATTTVRGTVELATDGENLAGVVVQGNDARLSDARTPLAHVHSGADITSGTVGPTFGGTGKATFTQHALLKGGATNAYTEIPIGTEGYVLKVVSGTPAWAVETGAGGGEANTTSNVGTGEGTLALAKSGVNLPFKTLKQGANITLTNNANDVTIAATGGAGSPDATTTVKGIVLLATDGESTAGEVVQSNDTRMSNARTPLAHVHSGADITSGTVPIAQLPVASETAKGIAELALSSETTAGLVVQANDTRLSDSRTPLGHGSTHASNGTDPIPIATTTVRGTVELATDGEATANVVVQGNDARMSNARTPLAHVHSGADITSGTVPITQLPVASDTAKGIAELATSAETTAGLVVQASDTRLSDSRTPLTHGSSHISTGSDPIPIATTTVRGTVELATDGESAANVVVQGNDARLSNARTPTLHADSHSSGNPDELLLGFLAGSVSDSQIDDLAYTKLTGVPTSFTPTAHVHNGADITSGSVGPTFGGTGKTTFTQHALLKGGASNAFTEIAPSTDGKVLKMVAGTPAWADETGGTGGGISASSSDTFTNKILLDTGAGNQIGVTTFYDFVIYLEGSNIIARNQWIGLKTSFSNADLSAALEFAIDAIIDQGANNDTVFLGSIGIKKGHFILTSSTDINQTVTNNRHGVNIEGSGWGTVIEMQGTSGAPLDAGIKVGMAGCKIDNMRIVMNQYVTQAILEYGDHVNTGRRTDLCDYDRLLIEGPNGNAGMYSNTGVVSGQRGIMIYGIDVACFFTNITRCTFISLDRGVWCYGGNTTSVNILGCRFIACEIAITQSDGSGQNTFNNIWIQGDTSVGTTGIDISGTGKNTNIANITSELHRENPPGTAVDCRTILLNTGVQRTKISPSVSNVWDNGTTRKTIVDNSGSVDNLNIFDERVVANGQHYFSMEGNIVKTNSAVFWNNFSGKQRFYDASYDHYWAIGNTAELTGDRLVSFTNMTADGKFITSNMSDSPFKNGPFLYHIYVDPVDSKFKAKNQNTLEVEFTSTGTTDAKAFLVSVFTAASTAKKPVYIEKGDYPCLSQLDLSGLYLTIEMERTRGGLGGTVLGSNDAVIRKNYAGNTSFILISSDVGGADVSYSKQRWINANVKGDGDGNAFEIIAHNENPDMFESPIITNFKEGIWFRKCWEIGVNKPCFYNCSEYAVHLSGDPTNPTTTQCVLVTIDKGNFRINTQNVYIERGMQIKLIDTVLEGATGQLNSVEITSSGLDTEIRGCSFESAVNGIDIIKDAGMGTIVTHNRFGGLYSTNQNVYHATATMNKATFKNNNIDPYTTNATATILLDSGSTQFCYGDNKLLSYATGVSLVFTDNSGNSATHIITPNFSNNSTTGYGDINFRNSIASGINRHIKFSDAGDLVFQSNGVINFLSAPFANVIMDPDTGLGTGIKLYDSDYTNFYKIGTGNITVDRRVGIPDMVADGDFLVSNATQISINKTINTTDNTVTATSQAVGDILVNNGTKFIRKGIGTALQVLRVNSGGTDLEYASLISERVGKSQANGGGTSFTIAHGLGALPTYAFVQLYSHSTAISYTWDATNITITAASALPGGTNNVLMIWRVIA